MEEEEAAPKRQRGRPSKGKAKIFRGFAPWMLDRYFRMPTAWIDICANIDNLAELKVVQYVFRHTWGYRDFDYMKHITLDEFVNGRIYKRGELAGTRMDSGTGLSENAAREGIKRGLEHGYLVCMVQGNDKYYALNLREDIPEPPAPEYPNEEVEESGVFIKCPSDEGDEQGSFLNTHPSLLNTLPDNRGIYQIPFHARMDDTNEFEIELTDREKDIVRIPPPLENLIEGVRSERKRQIPDFIKGDIEHISRTLGDAEHTGSNIIQATNLYQEWKIEPDAFRILLQRARETAQAKSNISKKNSKGGINRMPYFFSVLRGILAERRQ